MNLKEIIYRAFNLDDRIVGQAHLPESNPEIVPKTLDEQDAVSDYDAQFLVKFTYNSNAIEGSTLSLGDTELIFEGEFPTETQDKRLRDVFAAMGIKEGCELAGEMLAAGEPVSESLVKDLHEATALDCQPRTRGVYRVTPVYIVNSLTVPANPDQVRDLMADLVFAFGASQLPAIAKAAAFHAMFEHIHPFRDGNGRTGRILMNYLLQQAGYPPIAIKATDRARYLASLEDWQVRNNPLPLLEMVRECIADETAARLEVLELTRKAVAMRDGR